MILDIHGRTQLNKFMVTSLLVMYTVLQNSFLFPFVLTLIFIRCSKNEWICSSLFTCKEDT